MTIDSLETDGAWMGLDASGPFVGQLDEVDDVWYSRKRVVFEPKACDCPARCFVNSERVWFGPAYQDWPDVNGFRLWDDWIDGQEIARGTVAANAIHADDIVEFKPGDITLELRRVA